MKRKEILDETIRCVCSNREDQYGSPEDNFKTIADLWTIYKDVEFTATDIAMMMSLLKIARIKTGTATNDSFVDLAGYAACGGEIAAKEDELQDIAIKYTMNDIEATNMAFNGKYPWGIGDEKCSKDSNNKNEKENI